MGVRDVEVEIEELVLHGFGRIDDAAVAEAIQSTLRSRLATPGGDFGENRTVDFVQAPTIELHAQSSPKALGAAVADRLQGSVRR